MLLVSQTHMLQIVLSPIVCILMVHFIVKHVFMKMKKLYEEWVRKFVNRYIGFTVAIYLPQTVNLNSGSIIVERCSYDTDWVML